MTIVSKPSSARIRRISSTGTGAAPVTARRSDDMSNSARRGWSRIDWYTVGGPGSIDTRSSAAARVMTASTSNTACGMIVAPFTSDATMPAFSPNEWKNGLTTR